MTCIICKAHILTGAAYLVLRGEVNGGIFTAKETASGLCTNCAENEPPITVRFPLLFPVE